jgi:hypothetical protein
MRDEGEKKKNTLMRQEQQTVTRMSKKLIILKENVKEAYRTGTPVLEKEK